ncbi:unnamed protein product, partial [Urochloa humidicola]
DRSAERRCGPPATAWRAKFPRAAGLGYGAATRTFRGLPRAIASRVPLPPFCSALTSGPHACLSIAAPPFPSVSSRPPSSHSASGMVAAAGAVRPPHLHVGLPPLALSLPATLRPAPASPSLSPYPVPSSMHRSRRHRILPLAPAPSLTRHLPILLTPLGEVSTSFAGALGPSPWTLRPASNLWCSGWRRAEPLRRIPSQSICSSLPRPSRCVPLPRSGCKSRSTEWCCSPDPSLPRISG